MSNRKWSNRLMDDMVIRLRHVGEMPLGSREDFAIRWGVDEAAARRTLDRLANEGLVDHVYRGNIRRQQHRYWMTPAGADFFYDTSHVHPSLDDFQRIARLRQTGDDPSELQMLERMFSWDHAHGPFGDTEDHEHAPWSATIAGIREIFTRLALAEQVYPIAPDLLLSDHIILPFELPARVRVMGLTEIRWLRSGRLYHVLARYGDDWWVAFTYAGVHAKGTVIRDKHASRFDGLARYYWPPEERFPDYYDVEEDSFEPTPSLQVIVAADGWAKALAQEHLGSDVVSSGLWTGEEPCLPVQLGWSRSLVADRFRSEQAGSLDPNAANGIREWLHSRTDLAAIDSVPAFRMVILASQFPAINKTELKVLARASGKVFPRILNALCDHDVLLEDQGELYVDRKGIQFVAAVSRTSVEVVRETCGRWLKKGQREDYRDHNRGVARLALAFFKAGGELVGSSRATTNVPGVTQVQPDAVIRLVDGPYGSGWYRVEYERSAVNRRRIANKLGPYRRIAETGESLPVLFVCDTEVAVKRVLEIGRDLQIAATTLAQATAGAIDGVGVWQTPDGETRISCWR